MPEVPVPNGWKVVVAGSNPGGEVWNNVFHFSFTGTPTPVQLTALRDDIAQFWLAVQPTGIVALRSDDHIVTSVTSQDIRTVPNPAPEIAPVVSGAGTNTGEMMPMECAVVISWLTALSGRSYRGRSYIGGWTEAANGQLPAPTGPPGFLNRAEVINSVAAVFGGLKADGWIPSVLSLVNDKVARPTGVLTPIVAARVDQRWDTQRRRDVAWAAASSITAI